MRAGLENLLTDSIVSVSRNDKHTLPCVLAAMARDEVRGFPAQRPHQRAAWHMFLVQLAALTLWTSGRDDLPQSEDEWCALLLAMTGGDAGPWALTGPDDKPAFMQPPAPKGLNWTPVETPDAIDLLITSRNHDLKRQIASHAEPQDWVFALVSLQTSEGYGGAGNNGIARMNGGSSSRPLMGIAPATKGGGGPDPSAWWARDVRRLLTLRAEGEVVALGTPGDPALLWCLDWPEGKQLNLTRLDPWFIEVCRRVRLETSAAGLTARRTTSFGARIDGKAFKGVTGDPWAPITTEDPPKSLTLGEGDFTYRRLSDLMFSPDWRLPALAEPGPGEADCLMIVEALSRGNSKTDGWKSRVIPVPGALRGLFRSETAGTFARAQIEEIKVFDEALRNALALVAARGEFEAIGKAQYARTTDARARFDRAADALFFPALWDRLATSTANGKTGEQAAHERFVISLLRAAKRELTVALPAIPCAAIFRPRAEARARRSFGARLRKAGYLPASVSADEKEPADV